MKDLVTVVAVVGLALVGFFAVTQDKVVVQDSDPLQGYVGPELTSRVTTKAGFAQGGVLTIATSSATMTLTDGDIANVATLSIVISSTTNAYDPALALTLPASTTWPSLDANGTVQRWIIDNNQTAAGTTTTITAGVGVDIDGDTANDDVINGGVSGEMACWRLPTTGNIRCTVSEKVDAG